MKPTSTNQENLHMKHNLIFKLGFAVSLATATWTLPATVSAQGTFPEQPIRLVTPYPPGGALSVLGAIVTTSAESHFGQPMVSLIRAGGGGVTGATFVANAPADGYTLLLGEPTINSLRPQIENLPYKVQDFVPIARMTQSPILFVASASAPFDDLKGMVQYAKANPDKLVYSSDNKNGWTFTAFELLKKATDTKMRGIEFGGGGPAITNVLGGNTMAYAGDPALLMDHIKSGKLKSICVADTKRMASLENVPTCKEAGADVQWGLWIGVFAKAGTPADRIEKLRASFESLSKDEGFLRLVARTNSQLAYADGKAFQDFVTQEQAALKTLYESMPKN